VEWPFRWRYGGRIERGLRKPGTRQFQCPHHNAACLEIARVRSPRPPVTPAEAGVQSPFPAAHRTSPLDSCVRRNDDANTERVDGGGLLYFIVYG
jgi:hypothetical protein